MRAAYYTRPAYLDTALPFLAAMARKTEMHLFLELSPESGWASGLFNVSPRELPCGVVPAEPILHTDFPPGVQDCLKQLAGFHLVVHTRPRVFYPGALKVTWQVGRMLRALRPDLLHFDDVSGRAAPLLLLGPRVPKIVSIHDAEAHPGEKGGRPQRLRRAVLPLAAHVIFHSEHSRRAFDGFLPESITSVVPLGILDTFRAWESNSIAEEPATVLFFGRISPYKGLETLLAAAPEVSEQVGGTCFLIAGRPVPGYHPPPAPRLAQGTVEMHLDYIPNDTLCELFQRAAVVVLPYVEASQSGVLLTAYAFQKPVVATTVGGLPEYVEEGKTGLLVPPRDPQALAQAIVDLLSHPEKRRAMVENIRTKAQTDLSWPRIAEQTVAIYRQTVGGPR